MNFRHGGTCALNLGKSQKWKHLEIFLKKKKAANIRTALVTVPLFNFVNKEHCGKAKFTVFTNTPGAVQKTLSTESTKQRFV